MKEYDHASYQRKWNDCWGVFEDKNNNKFVDKLIHIEPYDGSYTMGVLVLRGTRVFLNAGDSTYPIIKLHYHPFPSGVYIPKDGKTYITVLEKRHNRSFSVGIRIGSTHNLRFYGPGAEHADFSQIQWLEDVPERKLEDKPCGWLSRRFYWVDDRLFYLNTVIGFIASTKEVRLSDLIYAPFIKPYLGDECQIKAL